MYVFTECENHPSQLSLTLYLDTMQAVPHTSVIPDSSDFLLDMTAAVQVVQHNLVHCCICVCKVALLLLIGLQIRACSSWFRKLRTRCSVYSATNAHKETLVLTGIATSLFKKENGVGGSSPSCGCKILKLTVRPSILGGVPITQTGTWIIIMMLFILDWKWYLTHLFSTCQ